MRKIIDNEIFNLILRIILGYFFIFAAIGKIADPFTFSKEISNYQILPIFSINLLALILPWIELISGILLVTGIKIKANAIIIGGLLIIFIIAVLSAMFRGLNINCGCFSNKIEIVGWKKVLENTILFASSLIIYFSNSKKYSLMN